jgi:hypothetical protein
VTAHASAPQSLRHRLARIRRLGIAGTAHALVARTVGAIWSADSLVIFRIEASQMRTVAIQMRDGERWTYRSSPAAELAGAAQGELPRNLAVEVDEAQAAQRVHLIEVDGHVAAWGFSVVPANGWPLSETRSTLTAEEGAACLVAFETLPQYRGRRLYPTLMLRILAERFQDGATAGYIWCRPTNAASYAAIKRVGFQEVSLHRSVRLFGFGRTSERRLGE